MSSEAAQKADTQEPRPSATHPGVLPNPWGGVSGGPFVDMRPEVMPCRAAAFQGRIPKHSALSAGLRVTAPQASVTVCAQRPYAGVNTSALPNVCHSVHTT